MDSNLHVYACACDIHVLASLSMCVCVVSTVRLSSPVREGKKEKKQREGAREASFHRETKIAVINGPELWTRGAFF